MSSGSSPSLGRGIVMGLDSGRNTGWGKGLAGDLVGCGLCIVKDDCHIQTPAIYGGDVWIEYPIDEKKVDPNDLIKLGSRAGRLQERYLERSNRVRLVLPVTWKGSVPKHIHEARIKAALKRHEMVLVDKAMTTIAPSLQNNVWDAIGLTLWAMGRDPNRNT